MLDKDGRLSGQAIERVVQSSGNRRASDFASMITMMMMMMMMMMTKAESGYASCETAANAQSWEREVSTLVPRHLGASANGQRTP
jgi:hypothetical protein